ncbi:hypothetical protein SCA03_00540 [Streptomyces cacaoi]|uniref:Uncharacterized protein n=1 Tax=Streptomyces cacaoi TaxID=1898 RepID=A0A4Y3QS67_STRCI|nr:hypothetical protein SCA03_00540 [Streptomyces cacaoi]
MIQLMMPMGAPRSVGEMRFYLSVEANRPSGGSLPAPDRPRTHVRCPPPRGRRPPAPAPRVHLLGRMAGFPGPCRAAAATVALRCVYRTNVERPGRAHEQTHRQQTL